MVFRKFLIENFIYFYLNFNWKCKIFIIISLLLNGYNLDARRFDGHNIGHDTVNNYLMEFGYLPKSDIETGNLRTEAQWKEAIKSLQKFGNVPETGVIDEVTRNLIKRPRCGVSDKPNSLDYSPDNRELEVNYSNNSEQQKYHKRSKRFVLQGTKWDHTNLTWRLVNKTMSDLDVGEVRRVMKDALGVWAKNSKLSFREMTSEHADIQVLFARKHHGDGYDFDGPGQVLAHAFYPGIGRGGDAHFDADETWVTQGLDSAVYGGTNLLGVAVHEFGHSLGLGHSSVEGAIMFPWYQGYNLSSPLPDDDRLAIQQLYPRNEKVWGPYYPNRQTPYRPVANPTTSTTTTTTTTTTQRTLNFYPDQPRHNKPRRPTYDDPRYNPRYPSYNPRDNEPRYNNFPKYPKPNYEEKHKHRYHHRHNEHTTIKPTTTTTSNPRRQYSDNPYGGRIPPRDYPRTEPTRRSPTNYPPYHRPIDNPDNIKPDTCNTNYDAIGMIRGELFIFKDKFLWRIGDQGLYNGYPHETKRLWSQLPENFTHVDAVYENREMKIVFFIGKEYYVFNSNILEPGYPQPLTNLGLPSSLRRIDAALIWGYNNRTYLYSDTRYWRLDEDIGKVELDYPRDMTIWQGIGFHIDAAFQYQNGKTYFFKGKEYWEFDDSRMRVAHIKPKNSAHKWMQCPRTSTHDYDYRVTERNSALVSSSSPILPNRSANINKINLEFIMILLFTSVFYFVTV